MNKLCIWPSDLGCNARRTAGRATLLHKRFATTQCAQSWRAKCMGYFLMRARPGGQRALVLAASKKKLTAERAVIS